MMSPRFYPFLMCNKLHFGESMKTFMNFCAYDEDEKFYSRRVFFISNTTRQVVDVHETVENKIGNS